MQYYIKCSGSRKRPSRGEEKNYCLLSNRLNIDSVVAAIVVLLYLSPSYLVYNLFCLG